MPGEVLIRGISHHPKSRSALQRVFVWAGSGFIRRIIRVLRCRGLPVASKNDSSGCRGSGVRLGFLLI